MATTVVQDCELVVMATTVVPDCELVLVAPTVVPDCESEIDSYAIRETHSTVYMHMLYYYDHLVYERLLFH
jgi:hypothetical protein